MTTEDDVQSPRWTKGCWKGDLATCCWVCWVRIATFAIRWKIRRWVS